MFTPEEMQEKVKEAKLDASEILRLTERLQLSIQDMEDYVTVPEEGPVMPEEDPEVSEALAPLPESGLWVPEELMPVYTLRADGVILTPEGIPAGGSSSFHRQRAAKLLVPFGGNFNLGFDSDDVVENQSLIIQGVLGPLGERPVIKGEFRNRRRGKHRYSPSRIEWRNLDLQTDSPTRDGTLTFANWREAVVTNCSIRHTGGRNGIKTSLGRMRIIIQGSDIYQSGGSGLYHGIYVSGADDVLIRNTWVYGITEGHALKLYANTIRIFGGLVTHTNLDNPGLIPFGGFPLMDLSAYADILVSGTKLIREGDNAKDRFVDLRNRIFPPNKYSNGFGTNVPNSGDSPIPHIFKDCVFANESPNKLAVYAVSTQGAWVADYYAERKRKRDTKTVELLESYVPHLIYETLSDDELDLGTEITLKGTTRFEGAYQHHIIPRRIKRIEE